MASLVVTLAQVTNLRYQSRVVTLALPWLLSPQTCSIPRDTDGCSLAIRDFAGCKPALPEWRGHLGLIVHKTLPYMHGTNTQIYARLRFEIAQFANLRYRNGEAPCVSSCIKRFLAYTVPIHRYMFACSSSFRRLQTCATGMERPLSSHSTSVPTHARY